MPAQGPRIPSLFCALILATMAHPAFADGLNVDIAGARAVGRAGAVTVSDDSGAALLINPAGMSRRTDTRVQMGVMLLDHDLSYRAPDDPSAPTIEDRGAPTRLPQLSVQAALGPVIAGVSYLETGSLMSELPGPRFGQPEETITQLFPHRYAGIRLAYHRRGVLVGAAARVNSWLGVGGSLGASRISLDEHRHIWAGFNDVHPVGAPERDLSLSIAGTDPFVPQVTVGILLAPELPLEMAVSASYTMDADLRGRPSLADTQPAEFPIPVVDVPRARARLPQPVIVRTGLRYLGRRFTIEAGGDVVVYRSRSGFDWTLEGVSAIDIDDTFREGTLTRVSALARARSNSTLRIAGDLELAPGFLWVSAGYAHTSSGLSSAELSPVFADRGGHTMSLGAEGQWNGISVSLGYARTITPDTTSSINGLAIINPFDAGSAPTGLGSYHTARDVVGATVEVAWP